MIEIYSFVSADPYLWILKHRRVSSQFAYLHQYSDIISYYSKRLLGEKYVIQYLFRVKHLIITKMNSKRLLVRLQNSMYFSYNVLNHTNNRTILDNCRGTLFLMI